MEPLVSVCIPAYNNAGYIRETIDSILNQTYHNIELVVVDDNSKDNTLDVIRSVKDSRVKVYHNEENVGSECIRDRSTCDAAASNSESGGKRYPSG